MEGLKYIFIIFLLKIYVHAEDPIIQTNKGKIKGSTVLIQGVEVDVFLGIPFARPPVGNLRFRHPQPARPWSGVKETKKYVSSCVQVKDTTFGDFEGAEMWNPNTVMSEDCLYLNIWAPSEARKSRSQLATMIWIFGGAFMSGSSTLDIYDGRWLAASENVIVASLNYRLGPFGFLSLNNVRAPGNMGLLDQTLAIQWIRDNILSFGGDPKKLTLFGESAGSGSVSLHVVSPLSQRLFRNAIMMSGSATATWATVPVEKNIERAKAMADFLKCPTENTTSMIDCFLEADAHKLANAQFHNLDSFLPYTLSPIVDGAFLTQKPIESLKNEPQKKDVLLGYVTNEGTYFLIYDLPKYFSLKGTVPINKSTAGKLINKVIAPLRANSVQLDLISYLYGSHVYGSSETDKYRYILDQASGDVKFKCPVIEFAQEYSKHAKVYMYSFEFRSRLNPWPEWAGVMHGYEIEFLFAQTLSGKNYSKEGNLVTKRTTSLFANFSKSGNPNNGECSDCSNEPWPEFTPRNQKYLVIDDKPTLETRENYMNNICGFWSDFFPGLTDHKCPEMASGSQTFHWRTLTSFASIFCSLMLSFNILF
uniref:Carboxylic ester hydrolase n=1 Tax=Octopus vulgaris TaxID=6645 RepID=A0A075D677_OCTVU|nr:acetylcholinesterase [Octopus vulgaris]